MSLAAGSRLGPFEILAPIGAGGMGEVYSARDTKLDREVAIKILPDALAHDPERLTRFEREAKVLASLNHPNIAAIVWCKEDAGGNNGPVRYGIAVTIEAEGALPVYDEIQARLRVRPRP
jgi:serine/threonine protein kinase